MSTGSPISEWWIEELYKICKAHGVPPEELREALKGADRIAFRESRKKQFQELHRYKLTDFFEPQYNAPPPPTPPPPNPPNYQQGQQAAHTQSPQPPPPSSPGVNSVPPPPPASHFTPPNIFGSTPVTQPLYDKIRADMKTMLMNHLNRPRDNNFFLPNSAALMGNIRTVQIQNRIFQVALLPTLDIVGTNGLYQLNFSYYFPGLTGTTGRKDEVIRIGDSRLVTDDSKKPMVVSLRKQGAPSLLGDTEEARLKMVLCKDMCMVRYWVKDINGTGRNVENSDTFWAINGGQMFCIDRAVYYSYRT